MRNNTTEVCGWQKTTSVRFCKKLRFTVQFQLYKILQFRFFGSVFCSVCCLLCMHSTDCFPIICLLPWWIGPTNCQPKWLRTRSAEIQHEEKYLCSWSFMLEDEPWMRQREKLSPNCWSRFLKTELQKLSFWFLNSELSLVRFGF